jgi:hypothetical protein
MNENKIIEDLASDLLNNRLDDLEHDPKDYLSSMGWDFNEFKNVNFSNVDITADDTMKLAEIIKDVIKENLDYDTVDVIGSNEVQDFISNALAGAIKNELKEMCW